MEAHDSAGAARRAVDPHVAQGAPAVHRPPPRRSRQRVAASCLVATAVDIAAGAGVGVGIGLPRAGSTGAGLSTGLGAARALGVDAEQRASSALRAGSLRSTTEPAAPCGLLVTLTAFWCHEERSLAQWIRDVIHRVSP